MCKSLLRGPDERHEVDEHEKKTPAMQRTLDT